MRAWSLADSYGRRKRTGGGAGIDRFPKRSFKIKVLPVNSWKLVSIIAGLALIATMLWEAFETILLPRTTTRLFRFTRFFFRALWGPWAALGRRLSPGASRERYLGLFGPLSILLLIICWAGGIIVGFGLVQWSLLPGSHGLDELETSVYLSGTTFFTLGLGDVKPETPWARLAAMTEAGLGFGFLASIISYLPVIYAAFSLREVIILRLDVRAGSPPSAAELLRQHNHRGDAGDLEALLRDFEQWAAQVLESHLSYPILCFYRSQHRDQSWLAALTTILDTCALLLVGVNGRESRQAPMTFALARRALIDIAHIFRGSAARPPAPPARLPPGELTRLRDLLVADARLLAGSDADEKLRRLRATYEPTAHSLSEYLLMPLPPWMPSAETGAEPTSAAEQLLDVDGATDVSTV